MSKLTALRLNKQKSRQIRSSTRAYMCALRAAVDFRLVTVICCLGALWNKRQQISSKASKSQMAKLYGKWCFKTSRFVCAVYADVRCRELSAAIKWIRTNITCCIQQLLFCCTMYCSCDVDLDGRPDPDVNWVSLYTTVWTIIIWNPQYTAFCCNDGQNKTRWKTL